MKTIINRIFYFSLTFSFLIYLLPPDYKVAVYSLSILGWIWFVVLLPLTLITFIWAGINNLNNKDWNELKIRAMIFVIVLLASIGYWFYVGHQSGNL